MAYIIINLDNTVHSIQDNEYEVLNNGKTRFYLAVKPDILDPDFYTWNGSALVLKSLAARQQIINGRVPAI